MKLIENIKEWLYSYKDEYKQSKKDRIMKKKFHDSIKQEANDRESFFNRNNLRTENDFSEVVQVFDIPEEYQLKGQQWQIMDKLNENSYFVSRYLRDELKFGDNLSQPDYYHIEDPSSGKPFSCKYLAIWTYKPLLQSKKKIYIVNSIISICSLGLISILITLGFILL